MYIGEAYVGEYASGKSEVAINRARQLAQRQEKVTLVDLDLMEPFLIQPPEVADKAIGWQVYDTVVPEMQAKEESSQKKNIGLPYPAPKKPSAFPPPILPGGSCIPGFSTWWSWERRWPSQKWCNGSLYMRPWKKNWEPSLPKTLS